MIPPPPYDSSSFAYDLADHSIGTGSSVSLFIFCFAPKVTIHRSLGRFVFLFSKSISGSHFFFPLAMSSKECEKNRLKIDGNSDQKNPVIDILKNPFKIGTKHRKE